MSGALKEVRDRIVSVKNTQQITNAMKMVSAAKLRRAQQAIVQMRPYADRLNKMLENILSNLDGGADTSFGVERPVENVLIVVVTSNRGLAGAYNTNINKEALRLIEERYQKQRENKNLTILCIGKKGYDFFRKKYDDINLINDHVAAFNDLSFDSIANISQYVMDEYEAQNYDRVHVAYGKFKNAAVQFSQMVQFLPVIQKKPKVSEEEKKRRADYIFEPDKETILNELVPSILQTSFHKFLLDTHASEHGARMTAMDKATENAEDLIKELKINYNKARQAAITNEISEIVGGAAALEG